MALSAKFQHLDSVLDLMVDAFVAEVLVGREIEGSTPPISLDQRLDHLQRVNHATNNSSSAIEA
jgi:hypothetical protein